MSTSPVRTRPVRRARALLVALVVVGMLLPGCEDGDGDEQTASSTTEAERSTTTTTERSATTRPEPTTTPTTAEPIDPTTPPPARQITPGYVQRVLVHLYGLYRSAMHAARAENALGERYQATMRMAFTAEAAARETSGLQGFGGAVVVAPRPGMPKVRVLKVLSASSTCVFSSVRVDLSPMVTKPVAAVQPYYVRLVAENENRANHTPWLIAYASFTQDGSVPEEYGCTP